VRDVASKFAFENNTDPLIVTSRVLCECCCDVQSFHYLLSKLGNDMPWWVCSLGLQRWSMKDPFLCTVLTEIGEGAQQKAASRCEIVCGWQAAFLGRHQLFLVVNSTFQLQAVNCSTMMHGEAISTGLNSWLQTLAIKRYIRWYTFWHTILNYIVTCEPTSGVETTWAADVPFKVRSFDPILRPLSAVPFVWTGNS